MINVSDTVTFTRNVFCGAVEKNVYQEITFAKIQTIGSLMATKLLSSTFCIGYPKCGKDDCELVKGESGIAYSEPIDD
ncbi:hypothetical protein ULO1_11270 [Carboxydocella sp. ULO1]|nr:hypothetical protein ULO1_11270 [Carboxydocella sp. ULO1]